MWHRALSYTEGISQYCAQQQQPTLCMVLTDRTFSATVNDTQFLRENGEVHYKMDLQWKPSYLGAQPLTMEADIRIYCDVDAQIPTLSALTVTNSKMSLVFTTRCQTVNREIIEGERSLLSSLSLGKEIPCNISMYHRTPSGRTRAASTCPPRTQSAPIIHTKEDTV